MKKHKREIAIVFLFVLLSILLHLIHYLIFHDMHHLLIYGMGDLAFLPLEVLIVTVILHRLLEWRDKKALTLKMSMLIGGFFSETGISFLRLIAQIDGNNQKLKDNLMMSSASKKKQFMKAIKLSESYKPDLRIGKKQLILIKELILPQRAYLADLLQHPILLEHKVFTDLLLATFHLVEELKYRDNIDKLTKKDIEHLAVDVERVYKFILPEWLKYIANLKASYPHLFSLYLRLNPLKKEVDVTFS